MLASSPTLSPPLATGAGGSPAKVIGNVSNGVFVFSTIASCSIVPVFVTTNVTSPAGTADGDNVNDIGPPAPFVSLSVTCTVELTVRVGSLTPPSSVLAPSEAVVLAQPERAPRIAISARTV